MTFSQKALEAAAMACYEHEPLEVDDFVEIPWDGISQGTRDRFMHKARATLSAALAVDGMALQGWQDISTAPKDGTPVDLWCANSEFPNRVTDAQWRKPTESEWFVHGGDGMKTADAQWLDPLGWPMTGDDAPTHWQPLPQPPAASDREERR